MQRVGRRGYHALRMWYERSVPSSFPRLRSPSSCSPQRTMPKVVNTWCSVKHATFGNTVAAWALSRKLCSSHYLTTTASSANQSVTRTFSGASLCPASFRHRFDTTPHQSASEGTQVENPSLVHFAQHNLSPISVSLPLSSAQTPKEAQYDEQSGCCI